MNADDTDEAKFWAGIEEARAHDLAERVETAAQVLHDRRHPLGASHACDRCRADARAVADVLTRTTDPALAAKETTR